MAQRPNRIQINKHGVWDLPPLTITSPYVDSNTGATGNWALGIGHWATQCQSLAYAYAESTLSPSQGLRIWPLVCLPIEYKANLELGLGR
jgi:hypothetical protein